MSKGRNVPTTPATPINPTIEEMAQALRGQAGLFILEYQHDDNCKTIRTQRWEDCTCRQVDHQLLKFNGGEG